MLLCSCIVVASKGRVYVKCCYMHVRQDWLLCKKRVKKNRFVLNSWLKLGLAKWIKRKLTVARAQDVLEKVDGRRWCSGALCGGRSGGQIVWSTLVTQNKEASLKFGSIPTSFPQSLWEESSFNTLLLWKASDKSWHCFSLNCILSSCISTWLVGDIPLKKTWYLRGCSV